MSGIRVISNNKGNNKGSNLNMIQIYTYNRAATQTREVAE
jgi:hypothetical protein